MSRKQQKRNLLPIVGLAGLGFIGAVGGTFALFQSSATFKNAFSTGTYKIKADEVFESPDNWKPGDETDKKVTVTNQGSVDAAVRICVEEDKWYTIGEGGAETAIAGTNAPTTEFGTASTNPSATVFVKEANTGDWTKKDNCYYYNNALKAGSTTSSPIQSVALLKSVSASADASDVATCTSNGVAEVTNGASIVCAAGDAAKYKLNLKVETVQFDGYNTVWTSAPTISNS